MSVFLFHTGTTVPIIRGIQMMGIFSFDGVKQASGSWIAMHLATGRRSVVTDEHWIKLREGYGIEVIHRTQGV